jgi:hypothetical protein
VFISGSALAIQQPPRHASRATSPSLKEGGEKERFWAGDDQNEERTTDRHVIVQASAGHFCTGNRSKSMRRKGRMCNCVPERRFRARRAAEIRTKQSVFARQGERSCPRLETSFHAEHRSVRGMRPMCLNLPRERDYARENLMVEWVGAIRITSMFCCATSVRPRMN